MCSICFYVVGYRVKVWVNPILILIIIIKKNQIHKNVANWGSDS